MFKAIVGLLRIYSESLPVPSRRYDLNSLDHELHLGDLRLSNIFFFMANHWYLPFSNTIFIYSCLRNAGAS